jgi:predicted GIY-YIG superfamily endonuclease
MKPILVSPIVYVLECGEGNYYVGITMDFNKRLAQHLAGEGAKWTKLHPPVRVVEIIHENANLFLENETTQRYIALYGADKVRGGSWCRC